MGDAFEDIMAGVLDDTPDIMVDPDMQKAIDRAYEINEILRTTDCTDDEKHAYLAEVDALWQEWHHETLVANGRVYFGFNDEDEPRVVELRGKTVYSDSFCIVRQLPGSESSQIAYDIKVHPLDVLSEDDPALVAFRSFAPEEMPLINAVAPLETSLDPTYFTAERALQYMELFHPELVAEIDRRIIYTNSPVEALLALRGLQLDAYMELESDTTKAALVSYINSMILLDDSVPHKVTLKKGKMYAEAETDDGKSLTVWTDSEVFYAAMDRAIHFAAREDDDNREFDLAVDLTLITDDHREVKRTFCVPIATISDAEPIRRILFNK